MCPTATAAPRELSGSHLRALNKHSVDVVEPVVLLAVFLHVRPSPDSSAQQSQFLGSDV